MNRPASSDDTSPIRILLPLGSARVRLRRESDSGSRPAQPFHIISAMRRVRALPEDIERRLVTLGAVLEGQSSVRFAYVFGGAARGSLRPLSDVDVAVFVDDALDPIQARLDLIGVVTKHLGTDEVDLVILNHAPTALRGRIVQSRRVIVDKDPFLRHRFESHALRTFLDFRIFERRLLDARFTRG
jgi:predicted nucleotidyltransferase